MCLCVWGWGEGAGTQIAFEVVDRVSLDFAVIEQPIREIKTGSHCLFFSRKLYTQSIDETPGNILPDNSVLDVGVNDLDSTNNFVYGIVQPCSKDEYGCEHFYMNANRDGSGSLFVLKPLDFENDRDRAGFKFRIFVNDQGDLSKPKDMAQVHITLNDINDNPPKFKDPNIRVQVLEDVKVSR